MAKHVIKVSKRNKAAAAAAVRKLSENVAKQNKAAKLAAKRQRTNGPEGSILPTPAIESPSAAGDRKAEAKMKTASAINGQSPCLLALFTVADGKINLFRYTSAGFPQFDYPVAAELFESHLREVQPDVFKAKKK